MPAHPPQPARAIGAQSFEVSPGPMHRIGFFLTLAVVSLIFGRLIEFLPGFLLAIRPAMLLLGVVLLISILTGRIFRLASSPVGSLLLGFTFWSAAGVPVSIWRGGAFATWTEQWLPALAACIATATLIDGLAQCRTAMYAIAASMLALLVLGFFIGQTGELSNRYSLVSGTLSNSNYLAMILLIGLPFCILAIRGWRGAWRILALVGSVAMAVSLLRTGSRAGIVGLGFLALLLLFRFSLQGKIALVLTGGLAVAVGLSVAGPEALLRYKTIFRPNERAASGAEASAMESSRARSELLRRSLVQTARDPFLGAGMGMFMVADNELSMLQRQRGAWKVSHNGYTQLSSETGIPGAMLYIAALFVCIRRTGRIWKAARNNPGLAEIADMAFALRLSLVSFAIQMCFSSSAYECFFPILAGLTAAFDLAVRERMRNVEAPQALGPPGVCLPRRFAAPAAL